MPMVVRSLHARTASPLHSPGLDFYETSSTGWQADGYNFASLA